LAQINRPIPTALTILVFSIQLGSSYGQALGIIAQIPTISGWLLPQNSDPREATILNAIVSSTCTKVGSDRYWNIIGIEKPWLNRESAGYFAAKNLGPHNGIGCYYSTVHIWFLDLDKIWSHILSLQIRYYVTMNPDVDTVAADKHSQAINHNYLPMLKKVRSSGLFELERPLPEDPGILIFRRKEIGLPTGNR
jgi:hypothetical protein